MNRASFSCLCALNCVSVRSSYCAVAAAEAEAERHVYFIEQMYVLRVCTQQYVEYTVHCTEHFVAIFQLNLRCHFAWNKVPANKHTKHGVSTLR